MNPSEEMCRDGKWDWKMFVSIISIQKNVGGITYDGSYYHGMEKTDTEQAI